MQAGCNLADRRFHHVLNVLVGEHVVGVLVVDLVHQRVEQQEAHGGEGERDEGHPPRRDPRRSAGQHRGFAAAAKFSAHEDEAPPSKLRHGPAVALTGFEDGGFGVVRIVHEGQETQGRAGGGQLDGQVVGNGPFTLHRRAVVAALGGLHVHQDPQFVGAWVQIMEAKHGAKRAVAADRIVLFDLCRQAVRVLAEDLHGNEGHVHRCDAVWKVVDADAEALIVVVGVDVNPRFVGDFLTLAAGVQEGL